MQDVYRFYNNELGVHFWTADVNERNVIPVYWPQYQYEGNTFDAYETGNTGSPVYRFYNTETGTHFYTINEDEYNSVLNNLPQYKYEGVAYNGATESSDSVTPLYRFYNTLNGVHFYTADANERQSVLDNFPYMTDEGVAYYVLPPDSDGSEIPGDTSTSLSLSVGSAVQSTIDTDGDADWFLLWVEANNTYTISLDGYGSNALYDPIIQVYNSSGTGVLTYADDGGEGLNSLLDYTPSADGMVYVSASGWGAYTGDYQLLVESSGGDGGGPVEGEVPGDTSTNYSISAGAYVESTIDTGGDTDWFSMYANGNRTYQIDLSGINTNQLYNPYIRVYDSSGTVITDNYSSISGYDSQLFYAQENDTTVYISVEAPGSNTGDYRLEVTDISGNITVDDTPIGTTTDITIRPGQNLLGEIASSGDLDWYEIGNFSTGQTMEFSLVGRGSDALGNPYLRLYNRDGVVIASDNDSGDDLDALLQYTREADDFGTLYIAALGIYGALGEYALEMTYA